MLELVELIKEIKKLEKELRKYDVNVINYPGDKTVVLINDFDVFMNIVKESNYLGLEKPYESEPTYKATTAVDDIIFEFYIEGRE